MNDTNPSAAVPDKAQENGRNRREVIRFLSDEDRLKAFQVLLDLRECHRFTIYRDPNEWWIYTNTLRKLRANGVQFEWLTENV